MNIHFHEAAPLCDDLSYRHKQDLDEEYTVLFVAKIKLTGKKNSIAKIKDVKNVYFCFW